MKRPSTIKESNQKTVLVPSEEMQRRCQEQVPRYMSIKQWVATYGFIPEGGIRHLIFSNDEFNRKVVKRIGSKILLDCQALYDFVEEQNQTKGEK